MKDIHTPRVDARYWTAITLASVFGTNLGDFYAHESSIGLIKGVVVLALVAAVVFLVERCVNSGHEVYYWLVIVLIRTGATNIADYFMYYVKVPGLALICGLSALIALFGWRTHPPLCKRNEPSNVVPSTNSAYWLAMLSAGIFGTVLGDICEDGMGEGVAAIFLTVLLFGVLLTLSRRAALIVAVYWTTIAVARTTGTAIGDWFAENKLLNIGLARSTLLSGIALLAVVLFWRSRRTHATARSA